MTGLRVSEIAKEAGVNLQTVYYYERRGLLPEPPRTGSNYRAYPQETVLRLRFIRRAQELGFTLKEVKVLLSLRAASRSRCAEVRRKAEDKVKDIDVKIRTLVQMRRVLSQLVDDCSRRGKSPAACPILEALQKEDRS